ncbi:hypothetical protein SLEP1_g37444 [Rubroshorea leprosula]|uniref:Protein NEDD1 n=1 Tax=Rubroshorea leprosula TaxID=152421 RepID=A0AAV5KV70_9ROSI|nr:hypothetical protein SLEP1_g37444 [Rubroshorea leprosula]
MSQADPSPSPWVIAASGGDTVKLFDTKLQPNDPCVLSYTPSPGCQVNSVKWNHTNLVVASAGDDKKISLWRKSGQSMGTVPVAGTDIVDGIEESILAISFSNKGSRYICSGGSGQVVRIWDLQRKRCIKWLRGHTNTITGAMYNSKDEHLASISLSGDLILHNLASGARAAELKDPNQQVLRVLDYSRISRHLLVTAGDDGTINLWDTTGRSPKVSWLKQHSAPTAGVSFSPSNDKMIASVGLDKKLYTFDYRSRRPASFTSYEVPFSSLAFRDDGWTMAAGTSNGRVVLYDVRAKLQPLTVLHAYSSSEAVTNLCWQRSKPVIVNESTCTAETALLGGAVEDSILMPDPLPSLTSSNLSLSTAISSSHLSGQSASGELSSLTTSSSGFSSIFSSSATEETPQRSHVLLDGKLARLKAPHTSYNFKDDMDVFSPLVNVEPITPSMWDDPEEAKKDHLAFDKKPSSLFFPSASRRFLAEDGASDHPISDWKSSSASTQYDTLPSFRILGSTPVPSSKSEVPSITPREAWGGLRHGPSRLGMLTSGALTSSSMFSGTRDLSSSLSQMSMSSLTSSNLSYENFLTKDVSANQETSLGPPEHFSRSMSFSLGTKGTMGAVNLDSPRLASINRRFSNFSERICTTSAFSDGTSHLVASPKTKKTGVETSGELLNSLLSRSDTSAATESGTFPAVNEGNLQTQKALQSDPPQQGSNFTVQLFQHTLEETLDTFQKSSHEDVRNLHIEIIRQSHMQSVETTSLLTTILENQAELMKEVKSLRQEIHQIRQLL